MRAVTILIGGTLQRPYLRRRFADLLGGLVGVRLVTAGELGIALGEPALQDQGRKPLPFLADRVLAAQAARHDPGAFKEVADLPGFPGALAQTLRDMRSADVAPEALAAAAATEDPKGPDTRRLKSLAALHAEVSRRRAERYSADDGLTVVDPSRLGGTGLLVYGVWELTGRLRTALERIAQTTSVTFFTPRTGTAADDVLKPLWSFATETLGATVVDLDDDSAASDLAATQERLFATAPEPRNAGDSTVELVSAPDAGREARHIARRLLRWADQGIAFHEMAVVYRDGATYRPLLEAALRDARIPAYLHEGTPLSERPVGRRVLALLALADERDDAGHARLDRASVVELLADARLPAETFGRYGQPSVPRWESITRRAGVIAGRAQWQQRLAAYAAELRARDDDDSPPWVGERIASVEHLSSFVGDLADALDGRPAQATWREHVAWLDELLATYVDDGERVREALRSLADVDAISGPTDVVGFSAAVQTLLDGLRDRDHQGAFGLRGVTVLDANSMRNLAFRAVAVVGLAERSFPPPPREDPLLLDDRRQQLARDHGIPIGTRVRGRDPEPLQFHNAIAGASERVVCSYARRGDDGRTQLPSSFLRATAQALTGHRPSVEQVEAGDVPCLTRLASGRLGPDDADDALTAAERRRTLLEDDPAGTVALVRHRLPRTAAGAEARDARDLPRHTAFDGVLSGEALAVLPAVARFDHPISPTALEVYATCPQRDLLARVLGLREIEDPEALERISPLDKGSVVHAILEELLRSRPDGPVVLSRERTRLRAIAEPRLDALHDAGRTGYGLLWRVDRAQVLEDLDRWLITDHARNEGRAVHTQHGFEVRFGPLRHGEEDDGRDPLTRDEPVHVALPSGRELQLTGRVDRVDHDGFGSRAFTVIDYKTGSLWGRATDTVHGGEHLQLPVYVLAVADALGVPPTRGEAKYVSVDRRGGFEEVAYSGANFDDDPPPVLQLLDELLDAREAGDFHRELGDKQRNCTFCPVKEACEPRRAWLARRKQDDPRVVAVVDRKERFP